MRFLVCFLILAAVGAGQERRRAPVAVPAATTRTAETTNNTAACSGPGYGLLGVGYCGDGFGGFADRSSTSGPAVPLTEVQDPGVTGTWNVSKGRGTAWGDVHSLLYAGSTTQVLAETQFWWCYGENAGKANATVTVDGRVAYRNQDCPIDGRGRVPSTSHLVIGYDSNDSNQADAVVEDLWERGFDGVVGDWSGDENTCKGGACGTGAVALDQSYRKLAASMAARHPEMRFALMYDDSAYKFTQCSTRDAFQPQCIQNKMMADAAVLMSDWFGRSNYLKVNGQPVLMFFVAENLIDFSQCGNGAQCHLSGVSTCSGGAACWSALWDGLRSYFRQHGSNPYLIFENNAGHEQADGNFMWVHPAGGSTTITADVQNNWGAQTYADPQLRNAAAMIAAGTTGANGLAKTYFAGAWKGFDDRMANWSPSWANGAPVPANVTAPHYPRVTSQQCGNTWLDTFAEAGKYFGASVQLPFLMVGTWDDYEEGTEIETGIDNCVTALTASVDGRTLRWTIGFAAPGSERTIDHYTVFYSTDGYAGEQLRTLATVPVDGAKGGSYSLDLAGLRRRLPAETVLYVKAVGKASVANHMSAGVRVGE